MAISIGKQCFIATSATLIGDVTVGDNVAIMDNAVLRGDQNRIIIGDNSNIQDNVTVHTDEFIERNYRKGPTAKIDLVLPKKVMQDLESDLNQGSAISLDDLIRVILRDYTLSRISKEIKEISKEENIK